MLTKELSINHLLDEDKSGMMELPKISFASATYKTAKTDAYAVFSLNGGRHRYGTAPKYASSEIMIRITANEVTALDESLREIVTHSRIYGKEKREVIDWIFYLNQLTKRPVAIKYTPIYNMMPEELTHWLDTQNRSDIGSALKLISRLTDKSDFNSACEAVAESINTGTTDADSLTALHERMFRYTPLMNSVETGGNLPGASKVNFNPAKYGSMLERGL